jgi:hypothetical protein
MFLFVKKLYFSVFILKSKYENCTINSFEFGG